MLHTSFSNTKANKHVCENYKSFSKFDEKRDSETAHTCKSRRKSSAFHLIFSFAFLFVSWSLRSNTELYYFFFLLLRRRQPKFAGAPRIGAEVFVREDHTELPAWTCVLELVSFGSRRIKLNSERSGSSLWERRANNVMIRGKNSSCSLELARAVENTDDEEEILFITRNRLNIGETHRPFTI